MDATARRAFPVGSMIASTLLVAILVWPLWRPLFLAAVVAGALFPWTRRLAARLRHKRGLAAAIVALVVTLAVVVPIGGMAAGVVSLVSDGIAFVRDALERQGVSGILARLPGPLRRIAQDVVDALPGGASSLAPLSGPTAGAASAARSVLVVTSRLLLQSALFVVALFFLLCDGDRLVRFLDRALPFRRLHVAELLDEFRKVSVAVLWSTFATAAVQALVAGLGFLVARVPQPTFFALTTLVLALIPAVGAAVVPVGLGILFIVGGRVVAGLFLIAWGAGVVAIVDNVLKPYLIKGGMELHGAIVFFALIGGLALFGAVGLLVGPLIVVFFTATLRLAERDLAA